MSQFRTRLHGVTVSSPFPLAHTADIEVDVHEVDIAVTVAACRPILAPQTDGPKPIARMDLGSFFYSLDECQEGGYRFVFSDVAEFQIDADFRRVTAIASSDESAELLPVLLGGSVISAILMMQGRLVLHASAVELNGSAIALVGNSGAGKSTLAAMACRAGGRLIGDDVLRVDTNNDGARCFRGSDHLRLRPSPTVFASASDLFEEQSADGRHLVRPERVPSELSQLEAVFLPELSELGGVYERAVLSQRDALFALLGIPRVQNWSHATSLIHFEVLHELVAHVPVVRLQVPRGMARTPFDCESLVAELLVGL